MRAPIHDTLGRPLGALRMSVTDRCNLRCSYCMPEDDYVWLPREGLLDFDELARVARLFSELGVDRIRLTGGEPLLRRGLPDLVAKLLLLETIGEVALTTNGVLLDSQAAALAAAGLRRITVSLDTLDPARFQRLTRKDEHTRVLAGIDAARGAGLAIKLDTVVLRDVNDDEIIPLLRYAASIGAELRFIEYMDVGGATRWRRASVVTREEILVRVREAFGAVEPLSGRGSAPAETYRLPSGASFGVIASVTAPFCRACDRSRVTADGMWYPCLYAARGLDLKAALRGGATDDMLRALLETAWRKRDDRGAEVRALLPDREALIPASALRGDPHLEMHTRGG